jgi:hypothetical protein
MRTTIQTRTPAQRLTEPSRFFVRASSEHLVLSSAPVTAVPLTLACWFRSNNSATRQTLMSLVDSAASNNHFALTARGASAADPLGAMVQAGGTEVVASTSTGYTANRWHAACAVFTSATDRAAYIDGGSKGTNATSRTPTGINRSEIGDASTLAATAFDGEIFWPFVWSAALTDEEARRLALGVPPWLVRPQSLVAGPDLLSLLDPFVRAQWVATGTKLGDRPPVRIPMRRRRYVEASVSATTLLPSAQSMTIATPAPTLRATTLPGAVGMNLTPASPTLKATILPGAQAMTIAPPAPTLRATLAPAPIVMTISLPGAALVSVVRLTPSPVAITIAPATPTLRVTIRPSPIAIRLTLPAPLLSGAMQLVAAAVSAGYAFALGYIGEDTPPAGVQLNPAALIAALRAGRTWAEALAICTPTNHSTWRPVGDPLGVLPMPLQGYEVYRRPLPGTLLPGAIPGAGDELVAVAPSGVASVTLTGFAPSSEQWVRVVAVNRCGVPDEEPIRLERVAFGAAGNLILPVPNATTGLRLVAGSSGGVVASWAYIPTGQAVAPTLFNLYITTGGAAFDFGSPDAQVSYADVLRFSSGVGTFADGELVRVIVRSRSADGAEEPNSREASVRARVQAPLAPTGLLVEVAS